MLLPSLSLHIPAARSALLLVLRPATLGPSLRQIGDRGAVCEHRLRRVDRRCDEAMSAHLDLREADRRRTMSGGDELDRLRLGSVRDAVEHPRLLVGDRITGAPEAGHGTLVRRILQRADAFAVLDLPTDLAGGEERVAV